MKNYFRRSFKEERLRHMLSQGLVVWSYAAPTLLFLSPLTMLSQLHRIRTVRWTNNCNRSWIS